MWVTVNIPADARPGDYEGALAITAGGKQFDVSMHLEVCGWKMPDPKDFVTFAETIQSPESVAMKYNVELWSDKHFELMSKSHKLIGQLGSRTTYIPLICRTNMGNDQGMVRWVKEGEGKYKHDFTIMEKYLDCVIKYQGKPQMVCFYVWDYHCNVRQNPTGFQNRIPTSKGEVVVSGKDGKEVTLPRYADPAAKALWKPVIDGVRERLAKRGLEKAMAFGLSSDVIPDPAILNLFKELSPGTPWIGQSHGSANYMLEKSVPVCYRLRVWHVKYAQDPDEGRSYGWKNPILEGLFPRTFWLSPPLAPYRHMAEMNLAGTSRGYGRHGADFWGVLKGKSGRTGMLGCRYNSWRNLDIRWTVLGAGRNGAISSHCYEMMREGVQETEARIFIEKAIVGKKITGELAKRCQEILDERTRAMIRGLGHTTTKDTSWWGGPTAKKFWINWFVSSGWEDRSAKLYSAAAEVAKKLGIE